MQKMVRHAYLSPKNALWISINTPRTWSVAIGESKSIDEIPSFDLTGGESVSQSQLK
jgi:hypothetical protein